MSARTEECAPGQKLSMSWDLHTGSLVAAYFPTRVRPSLVKKKTTLPRFLAMLTNGCAYFLRAKGFKLEDYKLYEECAAAELYHVRLGDSQYFHNFAGKNFLFTALVVYRRLVCLRGFVSM